MEKNMRMKFLKQRITVILLFVASVCKEDKSGK